MSEITISDIADRMGISKQSVGYALGNYPNSRTRLGVETRRRILETAHSLGYVPHHAGRRLARVRSDRATSFDQVGLIYLAPGQMHLDPVCLGMMGGAEHELSKLHASLTFVRVSEPGDWNKVERLARAGGVDGWLVYGPPNDAIAKRLRTTKLPFVVLGDHHCTRPVHCVNVDNFAVGRLAAEHLASLGHRRIVYMAAGMNFLFEEQIRQGFQAGVSELSLDDTEELFVNLSALATTGVRSPIECLQSFDPPPTAVFMPEFGVALSLQPTLRASQSVALQEMSILTSGATPAEGIVRNLTRVDLPMYEVGRHGAQLLRRLVAEPRVEPGEMKISPSLIQGMSTRPASGSTHKTED